MKESKITCDICGKEITNNGETPDDPLSRAASILFGAPKENVYSLVSSTMTINCYGDAVKTFDLCSDCTKKVAEFADELISKKENKK